MSQENRHTRDELSQWQSLPLNVKIQMTKNRIRGWINEFGQDGVYVSFSGGKDSTVLLDLVRNQCGYTEVPAVFVDTGLEYPEIREFVKSFENVIWLKPKMNFKQVIEKYGYPFISKEVSECVYGARKYLTSIQDEIALSKQASLTSISTKNCLESESTKRPYSFEWNKLNGLGKYATQMTIITALAMGMLDKNNQIRENIPSKDRSMYSQVKYKFFLDSDAPTISNRCCSVMKKEPVHRFNKQTGRKPMTAQMAQESRLRTQQWIQNGCNGFDMKQPISNPMAFWTEQDILQYIKEYQLPICSVYGDVVEDISGTEMVENQMTISDLLGFEDCDMFDAPKLPLKTTGCSRTGCMFCGYGCHLEKGEGRFERMKITHPKQYEWIMRDWDKGGLGYKKVIDWINEHGNLNIKY